MLIRELDLKFSDKLLVFTVLSICLLISSISCLKKYELYRETQEECFPNHNLPLTTEFWDAEDKELLKDVRTSFVSSHSHHYNQNCHQNFTGNEIEVNSRILQFLSRRKREEHMESSKALSSFYLDSIHNISPQKVRQLQAEIMRKYMNTSIDPCEDFYSYACGNWGNHNPIPQDKVAYDTFEILRESLDLALKGLLEEIDLELNQASPLTLEERNFLSKIKNKKRRRRRRRNFLKKRRSLKSSRAVLDPDDSILKAKNLYNSCMNYDVIKKREVNPLLELLKSMGGWPLLEDNWDGENFDWLQLVAQLRKYNNDILIGQWVGPDIQQSEVNIIQFDQTSLGLPSRDYFLSFSSQDALKSYRKFMINVLQLMGVSFAKSEDEADRIIEFETELAKIVSAPEDRLNISLLYKKMTIDQLHDAIPQIDWTRYLEIVQERTVDGNEKVIMYAYYYMKDLVLLLHSTDSATIANYLFWRFVRHRVNNLDNRFLDAKQRFYLELFGREKSPPRWKACVGQVNSNMGMAVGAMFVRKYFDENSKLDTLKMTKELQENFRKILNATEWIDVPTRKLANEKVDAMSLKIGYPDFILSKKDLDEKYFDLKVDAAKYFENTLNVLQHLARTEQKKLGLPVNKQLWLTAPAVVNAYYSRNKNQIMFPAGILQPPFYHRHFPKSLNYGGIGVVIGHELTHGFDDKGKLFDKNGNLNKWWTDSSIRSFHEKSKCLIQQYNNYTMTDGISIDGENTQG